MKVRIVNMEFNPATKSYEPKLVSNKTSNKAVENPMELSNFNSVGRSMVAFKGTIDVEALKKAKAELTRQRDEAQAKLNRAANYDQTRAYNSAISNYESEIERCNYHWYNHPWKKGEVKDKWLNRYYEEKREIDRIKQMKTALEGIVATCNAALKSKDTEINLGEILNNTQEAQNAINNMLNGHGGLNDRIAGYGTEKSKITRMLVEPLQKSKVHPQTKVPSAIMLYGATGTGKTTFLDAVAEQAGNVRVDNMTDEVDSDRLVNDFKKKLKISREQYLEEDENEQPKRTRTLLLINEAERILAMTPEYAKSHLEYELSESDMAILRTYSQNTGLEKNVNFFKGFLDHCSQAPKDEKDVERGALTVFITTNYPHLIHPDLLTRDGKLPYIALYPANEANTQAVIKHYTRLNSDALEAAKTVNTDKGIDMLTGISPEAKEKLKEYRKAGKLGKYSINVDSIPYEKISSMCRPSKALGAYSNDRYRKISEDAFANYLEDPETPYNIHFTKVLLREKRDIGPKRYAEFQKIYRILEPLEIGEREELIKMEKMGILDDKYKGRLDYIRMIENSEKETILAKQKLGQMTKEDEERLAQINEYQRMDSLSFEELNKADEEEE